VRIILSQQLLWSEPRQVGGEKRETASFGEAASGEKEHPHGYGKCAFLSERELSGESCMNTTFFEAWEFMFILFGWH